MPGKRAYLPANRRRAHILDAAQRVIADRGDLPVAELCRAAEVSRATLYHYFGGPEAVRLALLERALERMRVLIDARPTLVPDGPIGERPTAALVESTVRQSLRALFGVVYANADTILAALRSRNADKEADAVVRRIEGVLVGALEDDLRRAQDAGIVSVGDPHLAAIASFASLAALVEHGLEHRDRLDVDALVDAAVRLQLHGMLVTP